MPGSSIPSATISRLVTYVRILTALEEQGVARTSSDLLAEEAQVSAFQVRKDLAYFGRFGTRGMGYTVPALRRELRRILGLNRRWAICIVGMGRLGQALVDYPGFEEYDFELVGLFDTDPAKLGKELKGIPIRHPRELARVVDEQGARMGFLCVPAEHAQAAATMMVESGITGILNFAPVVLEVPPEVRVERVDFLAGLKRLAFYTLNPPENDLPEQVEPDPTVTAALATRRT
jgi:redox-sensing transcriptional repressor